MLLPLCGWTEAAVLEEHGADHLLLRALSARSSRAESSWGALALAGSRSVSYLWHLIIVHFLNDLLGERY